MKNARIIRVALIGYGGAFNMGKHHADSMRVQGEFRLVGVCDLDPKRTEQAAKDFPGICTFNNIGALLKWSEFDLAVILLPHNVHAPVALRVLHAGKHVIVEKPMSITVAEADTMISAAQKARRSDGKKGVMISVYHQRRWDGDYLAIQDIVDRGLIGEVFHVELFVGDYDRPGSWWRSDKKISGGAFYDWGAHVLYWLLRLIPDPVESVSGFFHKRVWHDVSNEDQVQAIVRFRGGKFADVQISSIARAGKPRYRILGTKGAIVDEGRQPFKIYGEFGGLTAVAEMRYKKSEHEKFYQNIADHLMRRAKLEITAESARRVVAIMEYAERSSKLGSKALALPYEK